MEPIVIWDLPDEPDGNVAHIAEHGITQDEVEEVVRNPDNPVEASRSSGRPITFGATSTGKFIAVIWEDVEDDPWTIYSVTAYEVGDDEEEL
jgi:hypothetical protein